MILPTGVREGVINSVENLILPRTETFIHSPIRELLLGITLVCDDSSRIARSPSTFCDDGDVLHLIATALFCGS